MNRKVKLFICKGASPKAFNYGLIGKVGDIHTLNDWIRIIFGETNGFFEHDTDKEVCDYIKHNRGLRLEKYE